MRSDSPAEQQKTEAPADANDTAEQPPEPAAAQIATLPAEGDESTKTEPASGFRVWLASAGSKSQATKLWRQVQDRHLEILSGVEVDYSKIDLGGQTLFRVLVGPLASAAEAEQLCERLRTAEPEAFCKVRGD
jgi:septal ring-binding cell division protein DamX